MTLGSLEPSDSRRFDLRVAGPAALLVSKLHKLGERREQPDRLSDKDALDVYRLLVAMPTAELVAGIRRLQADPVSSVAAAIGIDYLRSLFATPDALGSQMAARAVVPLQDPATVSRASAALATDLLQDLARSFA